MPTQALYFGEFVAPEGLESLEQLLADSPWTLESDSEGTHLASPAGVRVALELNPAQAPRYVFRGHIEEQDLAQECLADVSHCLARGEVIHRFELYDQADDLVGYWHFGWPQEA